MGLEPTTFGSEVRRAIHYATKPYAKTYTVYSLLTRSSELLDVTTYNICAIDSLVFRSI